MVFRQPDPISTDPPVVLDERPADNGPATLRALLLGFGIDVPMTGLRRRLRPVPAGTSIDDVEEVANRLGLRARQVMAPVEHVTLAVPGLRLLPAVAVVKDRFERLEFLLIWRSDKDRVQVMHTTSGAVWLPVEDLQSWLYRFDYPVSKQVWTHAAVCEEFLGCVEQRVRDLGATPGQAADLARRAQASWRGATALDATVRWLRAERQGGIATLEATFEALLEGDREAQAMIPERYWFATPDRSDPDTVILHGAVIVIASSVRRRWWQRWFLS